MCLLPGPIQAYNYLFHNSLRFTVTQLSRFCNFYPTSAPRCLIAIIAMTEFCVGVLQNVVSSLNQMGGVTRRAALRLASFSPDGRGRKTGAGGGDRTRMELPPKDFKSCKYLYNQHLISTINHSSPHLTTPKSRPSNSFPRTLLYCRLLLIAIAD